MRRFHELLSVSVLLMVLTGLGYAGTSDLDPEVKAKLDSLPDDLTRIEYLEGVVAEHPDDASLHFALGNLQLDNGKLDQAVSSLQKVTEMDPQFLGGWVNLGNAYDELGQADAAMQQYQTALELDPQDERTLCNLGGVYFKERKIPEALESFQAAIAAHPQSQLAHYNLAILFADSEIYREAESEWRKVVDIDPESDLGQRSRDNIEIVRQLLETETPELEDSEGR